VVFLGCNEQFAFLGLAFGIRLRPVSGICTAARL
jgi:hypothetical protein